MLEAVVMLSFLGICYAYFGYPLVLSFLVAKDHPEHLSTISGEPPSTTIIITVRNEAKVIRDKLNATLQLKYFDRESDRTKLQIIVASDASDDETDRVAGEFADRGVELVRLEQRKGKESAQGQAISASRGEIIVFTDARVTLNADALERFAAHFQDSSVGAVSSVDQVVDTEHGTSGEGAYVRYEMWLRRRESELGSIVGLSGSCFAVRREVCNAWRTDIPSDFALLLQAKKLGYRGLSAEDIVGTYTAVPSAEAEFNRKVRTVLRGITTLFACSEVLNPAQYGAFAFQIISHKLFRWLVPIFGFLFCVGTVILAEHSRRYQLLALAIAAFFVLALLGFIKPELAKYRAIKIPQFLLLTNTAILIAWIKYLSGIRSVSWTPKGG